MVQTHLQCRDIEERPGDVIPQQCRVFKSKHAPEEPECQSFVFCAQLNLS